MSTQARAAHSEDARQLVHIAVGGFALLLRYLHWYQSVLIAGAAVGFNMWILRAVTRGRLHRPAEAHTSVAAGLVFYPTSILLLLLLIPSRPDIVAAAWGIMAAGDGVATLVGRRAPGPRIPWNRAKSVLGTAAFVVAGGAAGVFLAWWCRPAVIPPPYPWFALAGPLAAAVVAAAIETVPIKLDDNLSVPLSAALTMWPISLISEDLAAAAAETLSDTLLVALAANAAVAAIGYAAKTVSVSGAVGGAIIGTTIFVFSGSEGWVLLMAAFAAASAASRIGLQRKTELGIAEARGGRRGVGNAVANTGIAAVAAVASALTYAEDAALIAFAAALTAGASDTIASEVGKAWGRRTWLLAPVRRVPPGTSGALSVEGTAAGVVGAAVLGAVAVVLGVVPGDALLPIVAAATIASFIESGLGATLEKDGTLNNDALNFVNTGIAAFAALIISGAI